MVLFDGSRLPRKDLPDDQLDIGDRSRPISLKTRDQIISAAFVSAFALPSCRVLNNCNWTRLGSFTYSVVSLPTLQYTLSICLLRSEKMKKGGVATRSKEAALHPCRRTAGVSETRPQVFTLRAKTHRDSANLNRVTFSAPLSDNLT